MKIEELLEPKRQEILAIAAKHGAPITFGSSGSVSRGEAGLEPDLDFLVEIEPGRSFSQDHGATRGLFAST